MVSFSMVHLRVLRSRLQLLSVSAQTPSPHSCPRIHRPSIDPRSTTLPPSYCRRISYSARACQGNSSSSETTIPVLPPVTATRRRAGPIVAAQRLATSGGRVETPKISKYRVDCNSPKVIKRKKKPAAVQEAGTTPGSASASASASRRGTESSSAPAPKQDLAPALKPAKKTSKETKKAAAAASKKPLMGTQLQTTEVLGADMAKEASKMNSSGVQSSVPSTPPTATVRKNILAGLPRPPSFTEPPSGIGSDVLFATIGNVPKGPTLTIEASSTSARRALERESANWPSQPPPKVGRTVYRTILDWSIHPTVQPGDFGSPVPLTPPPPPSFRTLTNGNRKPIPTSVSKFVQTITNTQTSPTKGTPTTTTANTGGDFMATRTRSRRRAGFEALEEAEELESRRNSKSSSRSNSRFNSRSDSQFESKFGAKFNSKFNSNIERTRPQETRDIPRATDNPRHKDAEVEKDSPKQEDVAPKRLTLKHRRIGFDSLEEDIKTPPKNSVKRSSSRFSF